jgi:hypothetical protein
MPFGTIVITSLGLSLPLSAVRTVIKIALQAPAALAAHGRRAVEISRRIVLLCFGRRRLPAPPAVKERFALFDSQQGNKKQADVVIDPLRDRLIQPAPGAAPGRTVQGPGLGLDARDEKTHTVSSVANGEFIL